MGTLACSTIPVKGGDCMALARGYHPQLALPPARGNDVGSRGGRPLSEWLSTGKGSRCLHRGSSGDDTDGARGERGGYSRTHDAVAGDHDAW
ncbi:hypothetical protein BHM03_00021510 [Ensete ventricosum]|nr:hypothetical protein BHM03_00021510 [Ensete ventricosum]